MRLTPDERMRFLDRDYFHTNATKPYELVLIKALLGEGANADDWRFKAGTECPTCRRELTNLDYFLSAAAQHGLDFLRRQSSGPSSVSGAFNVSIVGHHISVVCIGCGASVTLANCTKPGCAQYLYSHPGPGIHVRLTRDWLQQICQESGISPERVLD